MIISWIMIALYYWYQEKSQISFCFSILLIFMNIRFLSECYWYSVAEDYLPNDRLIDD